MKSQKRIYRVKRLDQHEGHIGGTAATVERISDRMVIPGIRKLSVVKQYVKDLHENNIMGVFLKEKYFC